MTATSSSPDSDSAIKSMDKHKYFNAGYDNKAYQYQNKQRDQKVVFIVYKVFYFVHVFTSSEIFAISQGFFHYAISYD